MSNDNSAVAVFMLFSRVLQNKLESSGSRVDCHTGQVSGNPKENTIFGQIMKVIGIARSDCLQKVIECSGSFRMPQHGIV